MVRIVLHVEADVERRYGWDPWDWAEEIYDESPAAETFEARRDSDAAAALREVLRTS